MTMINQNFTMYAGDTAPIIIDVVDANEQPLNVEGGTLKWGLREKELSETNVILKSSPEITVSGSVVTIPLNPIDTKTLARKDKYWHECELTDRFGNVSTIFTGKATIKFSGV